MTFNSNQETNLNKKKKLEYQILFHQNPGTKTMAEFILENTIKKWRKR